MVVFGHAYCRIIAWEWFFERLTRRRRERITGIGGFNHTQGSDTGSLNGDLSYGYYLTPGWEIGLRQALNYNFIDDKRDFWLATTTPFLLYNFRLTNIIVPYLGAFIGLAWNDRENRNRWTARRHQIFCP